MQLQSALIIQPPENFRPLMRFEVFETFTLPVAGLPAGAANSENCGLPLA